MDIVVSVSAHQASFRIDSTADLSLEQSQRDDMESLGYMMLYFLKGRLPWQGLRGESKQQTHQLIMDRKVAIDLEKLCADGPVEFRKYMEYVQALDFHGKPNYSRLRRMFRNLFVRQGFEYDYVFDWTVLRYMQSSQWQAPEARMNMN